VPGPPPGTVLVSIDEKQAPRRNPGSARRSPPDRAGTPGGSSSAAGELPRRGDFASREDLENQIAEFTIQRNKTAHPYKWSYDADAEHAATSNATPARDTLARAPDRNNP
jgi:hypothetical protein